MIFISSEVGYKPQKAKIKETKYMYADQVRQYGWQCLTFSGTIFIKKNMNGLFFKISNPDVCIPIDELYPSIKNVVRSDGLILASRRNKDYKLKFIQDKQRFIS